MNIRETLVFVLAGVALGATMKVSAHGQGEDGYPEQYPFDHRPRNCLNPEVAGAPACQPEHWSDPRVSQGNVSRLINDALWNNKGFSLLARAEQELGFSREKFSDGQYLADAWRQGLNQILNSPSQKKMEFARQWRDELGDDSFGTYALAVLTMSEAAAARGGGPARGVTEHGWRIFYRKLEEANELLDSCSERVRSTLAWHRTKLGVLYLHPDFAQQREPALRAAAAAWPDAATHYHVAMLYSGPPWGGSYAEVERIARWAIENSKETMGTGIYSILYQQFFAIQANTTGIAIEDSELDWETFKRSVLDLEERELMPRLTHGMASIACQMRDRQEARRLLDRLGAASGTDLREMIDNNPCAAFAYEDE